MPEGRVSFVSRTDLSPMRCAPLTCGEPGCTTDDNSRSTGISIDLEISTPPGNP